MRTTVCGLGLVLFGAFTACGAATDSSGVATGATPSGGAPAGGVATGGAYAGAVPAGAGAAEGTFLPAAGSSASGGESGGSAGASADGLGAGASTAGAAGAGGLDQAAMAGAGGAPNEPVGLSWPIDCLPDRTCVNIGYPDIDDDGKAHDCSEAGYVGHEGTDIGITFEAQDAGTAVRAAADGVVLFAFDGKYDRCPNDAEPDCRDPPSLEPGATTGNTVCTPVGPYCGTGEPGCAWCFAGGNVVVIRHPNVPGVFATRYDHLKKASVLVKPGDSVARGQKIAEAASAGSSTGPHLHFEVWGTGFYELADPWAGACGPNRGPSLWAYDPPWSG